MKATIIFEDDGDKELDVRIDFGSDKPDQDSIAHLAAAKAFVNITRFLREAMENESAE